MAAPSSNRHNAQENLTKRRVSGERAESIMGEFESDSFVARQIRGLQLTIGCLMFFSLVLCVFSSGLRDRGFVVLMGSVPIVSLVAVFQWVGSLAARPMVLNASLRGAREKAIVGESNTDDYWVRVFASRTIIGAALLEGSAFLFFIAYL